MSQRTPAPQNQRPISRPVLRVAVHPRQTSGCLRRGDPLHFTHMVRQRYQDRPGSPSRLTQVYLNRLPRVELRSFYPILRLNLLPHPQSLRLNSPVVPPGAGRRPEQGAADPRESSQSANQVLRQILVSRLVERGRRREMVVAPGSLGENRRTRFPESAYSVTTRKGAVMPAPCLVRRPPMRSRQEEPAAALSGLEHGRVRETHRGRVGQEEKGETAARYLGEKEIARLTDRVVQAIDRRIIAYRERLGRR